MGFAKLRSIVIADDSPAFLAAAATYVAGIPGYMLAGTASNAVEVFAMIESARPDVLLLDIGLAPSHGLEMVRRIKSSSSAPAVIALALFHAEETEAQARNAGADAMVSKEAFVTGLGEVLPRLFPARAA